MNSCKTLIYDYYDRKTGFKDVPIIEVDGNRIGYGMKEYYVHNETSDYFSADDIGDLYYTIEFMSYIILIVACIIGIAIKWYQKPIEMKTKGLKVSGWTILSSLSYALFYSICIWFRCYGFRSYRIVGILRSYY